MVLDGGIEVTAEQVPEFTQGQRRPLDLPLAVHEIVAQRLDLVELSGIGVRGIGKQDQRQDGKLAPFG